jgi:hypothetical protein
MTNSLFASLVVHDPIENLAFGIWSAYPSG